MPSYIQISELNPYPTPTGVFTGDMVACALDYTTPGTPHSNPATQKATVKQVVESYNTMVARQQAEAAGGAGGPAAQPGVIKDSNGNILDVGPALTPATFGNYVKSGGGLGFKETCVAQPDGTNKCTYQLSITGSVDGLWTETGSDIYYTGGNVGIGTTSPNSPLVVSGEITSLGDSSSEGGQIKLGPATANNYTNNFYLDNYEDRFRIISNTSEKLTVLENGNVGIGGVGNTVSRTLDIGTSFANPGVRVRSFGAGAISADANGYLSSASDERLKTNIAPYAPSLNEVLNVNPITFNWNELSAMETGSTYVGFSAQNIEAAGIEYSVGEDFKGYKSLETKGVVAALVNAVKQLKAENDNLKSRLDDAGL